MKCHSQVGAVANVSFEVEPDPVAKGEEFIHANAIFSLVPNGLYNPDKALTTALRCL